MKYLLFIVSLCSFAAASAQNSEPCAFDQYLRNHARGVADAEAQIVHAIGQTRALQYNHTPGLKIIPVVVHVIHNGGTENISDAQIQSQITILNQDFRRKVGTPGFGNGADALIEFCIARKDPQGRCTNGIIRVQSTLTNHQTSQRSQLKQLSYWDNTRYLNMYVVKNINNGVGILGYSSFPGGPPDEDGIVVRHDYFGNIGTAANGMGRTTTHEIGHWFGLYHTFQNGCGTSDTCNSGDNVCDTPPVANPNFGCPSAAPNSCTNDSYPDQIQNYEDYTNDACKSIFTLGQKNRMHAALASLRPDVWAQWNIDSTGCDSGFVNGPCGPIADFVSLNTSLCSGSAITFFSRSQNNPTSYSWTFPGGTPATSTVTNPVVTYATPGVYAVKLVVSNGIGLDSLTLSNYITVTPAPIGQPIPFYEGFETTIFPPNGITIDNPDGGVTWGRDVAAVPYAGIGCAKIDNLINTNYGQSDAMLLPRLDFSNASGAEYLYFYWAYARSDANYSDELTVLASKDCGVNWTQLLYRTGNSLATGPTQTTPYIPDGNTTWKSAKLSLAAFAGERNLQIKFINTTDGGNNLYIDNIGVGEAPLAIAGPGSTAVWDYHLYPNPASNTVTFSYPATQKLESIRLISLIGQTIEVDLVQSQPGTATLRITNKPAAGIYYLIARTSAGTVTRKLQIQ